MNGGSLDKLVPAGVGILDEKILAWVTSCTVRGLKYLKDNLNIIHRGILLETRTNKTHNSFLLFLLLVLTRYRRQTNKYPRQHQG